MMDKEGSTKVVIFMTFGESILVLGRGYISHMLYLFIYFKIFSPYPGHA